MAPESKDQLSSEWTPGSRVVVRGQGMKEKREEMFPLTALGLKYEAPSIWSNCSGVGPYDTPPLTPRTITHEPSLRQQFSRSLRGICRA